MILLGLLNDSATFIGTLTTIVVLCIVSQGNFIHKILEELKVAIEGNINALKNSLMRPVVLESDEYKEFSEKINSMDNTPEKLEGEILSWEIKTWIRKFDSDILTQAFKNTQAYIDEAHSSNEQFLSPHYCFLFCLVLFLCDELVGNDDSGTVSACVNMFLVLFIAYSYILLLSIWAMYIHRFGLLGKVNTKIYSAVKDGIIHFDKRRAFVIGVWILTIMMYFHYGRFQIATNTYDIQWRYILFMGLLDIVLLALAIGFIYATHEIAGNLEHKNLSYNFTFVHFIFGVILSLAICGVVTILRLSMSPNFLYIQSYGFIKWGSIGLIVVFGLVFPSYLPYAVFCRAEKNIKELIKSTNLVTNSKSHLFLEKIRRFNEHH